MRSMFLADLEVGDEFLDTNNHIYTVTRAQKASDIAPFILWAISEEGQARCYEHSFREVLLNDPAPKQR